MNHDPRMDVARVAPSDGADPHRAAAGPRLGYVVPEFPGQTHSFFWREIKALQSLGVEPRLVSTRPPDSRIQSHAWTQQAKAQTQYLFPPKLGDVLPGVWVLLATGPRGWKNLWPGVKGSGLKRTLKNLSILGAATKLARIARSEAWSHLHAHSCADAGLVVAFAAHLAKLPYSMTLHGPLKDYGPGQPFKWRHAAFVVVITRTLLEETRAILGSAMPALTPLAPMGVDLADFKRAAPYQPWSGQGPARLVACGRLNRIKGHQELIEAVGHLRQRGIDARLNICGQDERGGDGYAKTLRKQVEDAGLQDAVTLLGAVSEQRVRSELESAHVFALASHHEPLGVAYMEAMAMGVPTLGTCAGGVKELIDDGVDGVLVEPKNVAALTDALEWLLRDPAEATRLAAAGRAKIEHGFHSGVSAAVIAQHMATATPEASHAAAETGSAVEAAGTPHGDAKAGPARV